MIGSSHLFWAVPGFAAAGPLLGVWRRLAEFFRGTVEIAFGSQRPILLVCLDLVAALLLLDWIWLLTPLIGAYPSFLGAILVNRSRVRPLLRSSRAVGATPDRV